MDDNAFTPSVCYHDRPAMLDWLERAFGFEITLAIDGPPDEPAMGHYEMSCAGVGRIMISGEWADWTRSPAGVGGSNTQWVHVQLPGDIDAHCARARAAGARIVAEPDDQFYGDRTYRAVDPEGHHWTFAMHVRDVTRAEAEATLGQSISAPGWA
ncbi:VOC family protein [Tsukamurella soli]|uniref:VOC family protein n=1 Tax=Tsukamurella soli TaxID=644556 RepID=A0ABP8KAA6_9ACTN